MTNNEKTSTYERPTIERVGSLADLTQEGQRVNTDARKTKDSSIAFESI